MRIKLCTFLLPFLLVFFGLVSQGFAQIGISAGYLNSRASGLMSTNINKATHGFFFEAFGYIKGSNLAVGVQFAHTRYGYQKNEDYYQFNNGYEGIIDVEVGNYFNNNNLFLQYDFLKKSFVRPYVLAGAGITKFYSDLNIDDPRESFTSDCPKPLEHDILLKDRTVNFMLGTGVKFNIGALFDYHNEFLLDLKVNYLGGGQVRYMNLNAPSSRIVSPSKGENVAFDFVSQAQPDVVHQYHVGRSYASPMQMISVQVGLTFQFAGN